MEKINQNGWENWEDQLNHKTERRRKAHAIWRQRFLQASLIMVALAAVPGAVAITLFAFNAISLALVAALSTISLALMFFISGYTFGILRRR